MSPETLKPSKTSKILSSPDMNKKSLCDLLTRYHTSLDQWGTGNAKTVADLLEEIKEGECTLKEIERER